MFLDEARIAAQLHHPNVIQVFELGKLQGSIFIAMEYVEGIDLRKILQEEEKRNKTLPYGVVAYITAQVCAGLAYAHQSKGVDGRPLELIHRDVSPQNVMVSFDGDVKLVDFGIAKAGALVERSKPGVIKGKFLYLSPEQLSQDRLDHRSDLFALGTMMYELTCGKAPFYKSTTEGVIYAIRTEEAAPPETIRPDFPPALSKIIMKCLVKDRTRRYQSATDIQRDLEAFLRGLPEPFNKYDLSLYVGRLFGTEDEQTVMHVPGTGELANPAFAAFAGVLPGARSAVQEPIREDSQPSMPTLPTASMRGPEGLPLNTAPIPLHLRPDDEPSATGTSTLSEGTGPDLRRPDSALQSGFADVTGPEHVRPSDEALQGFSDTTGPELSRPTLPTIAPPMRRSAGAQYASVDGEHESTLTGATGLPSAADEVTGQSRNPYSGSYPQPFSEPPISPRPPSRLSRRDGEDSVSERTPSTGSGPLEDFRTPPSRPDPRRREELGLMPQDPLVTGFNSDPLTRPIRPGNRADLTVPEDEPMDDARRPIIFGVVAFVVVLLAGLLGLWLFRGQPADGERPSAPERPGHSELMPSGMGTGPDRQVTADTAPRAAAPAVSDLPASGMVSRIPVIFRGPRGTIITHDGTRFSPGAAHLLLPGRFAYQYRCPGKGLVFNASVELSPDAVGPVEISLDCRLRR